MKVVPRAEPPNPDEIIATAREFLGVPYVWGGLGDGGYDCSGFVNKVYSLNGYDLPRTSREQFKVGLPVKRAALAMGDLLFFVSNPGDSRITHVAMYIADSEFIHNATGKGQVSYDRLTSRYYDQRFYGARRILSLKPGRYSTQNGSARSDGGDSSPPDAAEPTIEQIIQDASRENGTPTPERGPGESPPPATGPTQTVITEHAADERPPQLLATFAKGALTRVGPTLLRSEETSIGVRLGIGGLHGDAVAVAAPEFSYFGHDNALRVRTAVPFELPLNSESKASENLKAAWDEPVEYTKIIQEISFGQKESQLYLDLSRTASGTLGHGQLMRTYTPNVKSRSVPDFVLATDALSLSADGYLDWVGGESFIDDVLDPNVVGALVYVRPAVLADIDNPLARGLSLGVAYAGDMAAPYALRSDGTMEHRMLHGGTLDAELKWLKTATWDVKSYLAGSTLVAAETAGLGGAFGTLIRANIGGRITHVVRLRLEGQLSTPTFIPGYFDTTYRLNRRQAPVDDIGDNPVTKLKLLEELDGTPNRWGVYGELTYQMHRRISVMLSYEDGGTFGSLAPSERYVGRNVGLVAQVNDLYLPRSSRALSLYAGYQLRNFEHLLPLVASHRANEYVFAAVAFKAWRYVSIGGSLRKGYNSDNPNRAAVDGVLNLVANYEL